MVDWSFLAQGPSLCYGFAATNIRHVGKCTGQLVQLIRQTSATNIHVIGHSLGAQMANFIAQNVSPILPRISGLDPAGMFFPLGAPLNAVLDKTDATFVDVYHTSNLVFGKADIMGQVDFHFNDGSMQPGCEFSNDLACSHYRAVSYFAESIAVNAKRFYGKQCSNLPFYLLGLCSSTATAITPRTILAGEDVLTSTTGVVKVPTAPSSLYALGQY